MELLKFIAILAILLYYLETSVSSQLTEVESKTWKNLEKSLKSPKISKQLRNGFLKSYKNGGNKGADIIIEFEGRNYKTLREFRDDSTSGVIKATATRGERISSLVERLEDNAALSQKDVIHFLEGQQKEFRALWAANEISVKEADADLVTEIARKFGNVARIRPIGQIRPPPKPKPPTTPDLSLLQPKDVPWNINHVKARCRDIKCLGEGVVVGFIDTGVLWSHVELKDNYRKDFNWFDPVMGSEFPTFVTNRGTHSAGIAVGKTKGVAPKAQWISCLAFEDTWSNEVYLKACGEFMLCPHLWNNTEVKDCSKAPHIINNGWYVTGDAQLYAEIPTDFYYGTVAAWNAAGILSPFGSGNDGPYCGSINIPSYYDISFSVGSIDNSSNIDLISSRGPVLNGALMGFAKSSSPSSYPGWGFDESQNYGFSTGICQRHCVNVTGEKERTICTIIKPDIVAPGVNINSSDVTSDNAYTVISSTSKSTAMVSGILALMLCANNQAHGNRKLDVATAYNILRTTADTSRINLEEGNGIEDKDVVNSHKDSNLLCNIGFGLECGTFPNNVYGAGEVDSCAAVRKVRWGKF